LYAVEMKGIYKRFGSVIACNNVTLSVKKGCIHAIVGENGAGKTTLMSILYGIYKPDQGEIIINGKKVVIKSALDAIKNGIGMVFQHYSLIPTMTVFRNIILGLENRKGLLIPKTRLKEKLEKIMTRAHINLNLDSKIFELSVGAQQKVELLKLLFRRTDILIFDEPTALLTPHEIEELFKTIENLKATGKTIIFISHKLSEIMRISDYVTVLRKGKSVATVKTPEVCLKDVAKLMIGSDIAEDTIEMPRLRAPISTKNKPVIVELRKINYKEGNKELKNINLSIHQGEILGIAGVEGNGQSELVKLLVGISKPTSGNIYLNKNKITDFSPIDRIRLGIKLIPEDRHDEGIIPDFSFEENLLLGNHENHDFNNRGFINWKKVGKMSEILMENLTIVPPNPETKLKHFSGGNQQKTVFARTLIGRITFFIVAQPTRGLDFKSTDFVHHKLVELANQGIPILLISSSLDEIFRLSDRIAVMYKGEIVAILNTLDATKEEVGLYMTGIAGSGKSEKV